MVTTRATNKGSSRRRYKAKSSSLKMAKRSSKSRPKPSPPPAPALSDPDGPKPSPSPNPCDTGAGGAPPPQLSPSYVDDEPPIDFSNYDFSLLDVPSRPPPPPPPPPVSVINQAPSQPSRSVPINPYQPSNTTTTLSRFNSSTANTPPSPRAVSVASNVSRFCEAEDTDPLFDQIYADHKQFVDAARVAAPASLHDLVDGATNVSEGFDYRRRKAVLDFVESLGACAPKYDRLLSHTSKLPDTFSTHETSVPLLFVVLSGLSDKKRKARLLSDMLVDWVSNLRRQRAQSSEEDSSSAVGIARKKGKGGEGEASSGVSKGKGEKEILCDESDPHAPSTINTYVRNLLAAGREYYDWHFTFKADLSFDGGFCAFFKRLCSERQKKDVSCHRRFFYFMFLPC